MMNRKMLQQMQQLQNRLEKAKNELGQMTVEGTAGGGAVSVLMDGHMNVREVTIAPEAVDPEDVETLQDMVLSAVNDALQKAQDLANRHLGAITGGLGLPGM
jgi:DNA-binding YbaB/EbfC family protein